MLYSSSIVIIPLPMARLGSILSIFSHRPIYLVAGRHDDTFLSKKFRRRFLREATVVVVRHSSLDLSERTGRVGIGNCVYHVTKQSYSTRWRLCCSGRKNDATKPPLSSLSSLSLAIRINKSCTF